MADTGLAEAARYAGDPEAAQTLLACVVKQMDEADGLPSSLRAQALTAYGRAATAAAGDRAAGRAHLGEALAIALTNGERPTIAAKICEGSSRTAQAVGPPSQRCQRGRNS
jgi:hypothetical protein